jgi:hypothetical protein
MPKYSDFNESRKKEPKIGKIAREFGVKRTTLSDGVETARSPITATKSLKNILQPYQEKALVNWTT